MGSSKISQFNFNLRLLKQHWSAVGVLALAFSVSGCESKTIVYKPSVELDPLPVGQSAEQVAPAGDPLRDEQWNLDAVGLDGAEALGQAAAGSPNVTVAILSTGIDYTHEDLVGRVLVNDSELEEPEPGSALRTDGEDDDNNGLVDDVVGYDIVSGDGFAFDRHGAGTAAAGIIAARRDNGKGIAGLMGDVRLYPVRYIDDNGLTSVVDLMAALEVVVKTKPDVIFLQSSQVALGGPYSEQALIDVELKALKEPMDKLASFDIPIVVNAGNNNSLFGERPLEAFLRGYRNVVIVTASDKDDTLAFPANRSPQYVTTAAPGTNIKTLKLQQQYGEVSSPAYAAAHVAAAFGLAIAQNGKLPSEKLLNALLSNEGSDEVDALAFASLGRNRLNIAKFLQAVAQ